MADAKIAVVGEFRPTAKSHAMLNQALDWLQEAYHFEYEWMDPQRIEVEGEGILRRFAGIWSAPGSPVKSLEGALAAIRYAREHNVPHLGTCAGFQHAIIEFARNALGIEDAQHEEYDSTSPELFVSKLACSLVGKTMLVRIRESSRAFRWYGTNESSEDYDCNFGVNPGFQDELIHPDLRISGVDGNGEIRMLESTRNDFFVATLFIPHYRATKAAPHPLIKAFVQECAASRCA